MDVKADGNCFFRALSVCLYGDERQHGVLRQDIAKYTADFCSTIFADVCGSQESVRDMIATTFQDGTWPGDNIIKAAAYFLRREIHVFIALFNSSPYIFYPESNYDNLSPILICFHEPGHYLAVQRQSNDCPTKINSSNSAGNRKN